MDTSFRAIIDHSHEAVVVLLQCQIQYVNPAAASILALPEAELIQRNLTDFLPAAEQRRKLRLFYDRAVNDDTGHGDNVELDLVDAKGQMKTVQMRAAPIIWQKRRGVACFITKTPQRRYLAANIDEREAVFQALIDRAYNGIAVVQNQKIVYLNEQLADMLGYTVAEMLDSNFTDYLSPEMAPAALKRHKRRLAGDPVSAGYESTVVDKNGRSLAAEFNAAVVPYHGQPASFVLMRDITESKRQQAALERQNRELTTLFNAATTLSSNLSLDKVLEAVAVQMTHALDASRCTISFLDPKKQTIETLVDFSFNPNIDLDTPPAAGGLRAAITVTKTRKPLLVLVDDETLDPEERAAMVAMGVSARLLLPLVTRDEVIGIVEVSDYSPKRNFSPEDIRLATSLAAQAAVAMANATLLVQTRDYGLQLAQILSNVPDGVLLLDAEERLVMKNPAAENYLPLLTQVEEGAVLTHLGKRPLSDLLQSPANGLWHEVAVAEQCFDVVARRIETGPAHGGWVLVLHDMTREREIKTRLLQQDRLAAVGQLAAGIAHDFNNIMTVISLYTDLIERSEVELSPAARQRLAVIADQSNRAADLIEQILDFSRRSVLERYPMDFLPFLKEVIKLLERTLIDNIHIQLIHELGSFMINADPTRMQQMVMNLAVNARDAMPQGGDLTFVLSHLTLTEPVHDQIDLTPGSWLELEVRDQGTGIASEVLPHVFDPFYTTKAPGSGSGLGLAQVWGIVKQHDGQISVSTSVNEGTTFKVYLPLLEVNSSGSEKEKFQEMLSGVREIILVVEDNEITREALVESLGLLNYETITAVNGIEALAIVAERNDIVLIVSDVVMPQMGGVQLLKTLREQGNKTAVLLITGHPLNKELDEILSFPDVEWLPKPLTLEKLGQAIRRSIKK